MVNHTRKIFSLFKPTAEWFNDAVRGSGLSGLCMTGYTTISHGMQGAFVERWHRETSSFHLPVGEMTITLHDVHCLLHLPIGGDAAEPFPDPEGRCDRVNDDLSGYGPRYG